MAQIMSVARAVSVLSGTEYAWFGLKSPALPPETRRALSPALSRGYLLHSLQTQLYDGFYCQGRAVLLPPTGKGHMPVAADFVKRLADANVGEGCLHEGWQPLATDGTTMVAKRDGLVLRFSPGHYRTDSSHAGVAALPGMRVEIYFPNDLPAISPGFYMALGNKELSRDEHDSLLRIYWHVSPGGAVKLVRLATELLNEAGLPFKLKVVNDPARFGRCDTAVLYLRKEDFTEAREMIFELYSHVAGALNEDVPALTKKLAPGVGLAEGPPGGESFGLHRCALVAEGLLKAYDDGQTSRQKKVDAVVACFHEAGIDSRAPYLNPSSEDLYDLPKLRAKSYAAINPHGLWAAAESAPPHKTQNDYLEVAVQIGRKLVRDAIWHGRLCNWLGALVPGERKGAPRMDGVHGALGPDLYNGTSGVALFLGELSAHTADKATRDTSYAAIRHALSRAESLPVEQQAALFTGSLGVAVVAARLGTLFGDDELLDASRRTLQSLDRLACPRAHDYLGGSAGAIVAALLLREWLGEPAALEFARQLGDALLQAARKTLAGYSWPVRPDGGNDRSPNGRAGPYLTGLSHGAAGVGLALAELHAATDERKYGNAAGMAFSYERSCFDSAAGNWPDLRSNWGKSGRRGEQAFRTYWCHGAPGIALSRLRAYRLLGEEQYRHEAEIAMQTTRKAVQEATSYQITDFSLCHGLGGNCEVLLPRSVVPGPSSREDLELVHATAQKAMRRFGTEEARWPSGLAGETPGLMLGLAGIGLFYLRLHDPSIPSVLLFNIPHSTSS